MQVRKILFLLLGVVMTVHCLSQDIDSVLTLYHDNFQPEKVHLHFDKSIYAKGETLWYKAYLMAGEGKSDYSRNFYVDWYDENGSLLKHTIQPVFESSARGSFEIPADYTGNRLHLKAYTQWMLNFDTAFLYTQTIRIAQLNNSTVLAPTAARTTLRFFPEGGDMIAGLRTNLAFMATDQTGKPVAVRGGIFDKKNQLIDSFISMHDGMGVLTIEPSLGEQYTCNWIDEMGINHTTALPTLKNYGIALETQQLFNKIKFVVNRTSDATDNFKQLHMVVTQYQKPIYNATINLTSKKSAAAEVNTENLPTGILQFTVFDANWIPVAERVMFIKNMQYEFFPEVNWVNKRPTKRGKNTVEIFVPDSLLSNLSISITDAELYADSSTNIFSQLLLSEEVKGYIHDPAYYFSSDADSVAVHLDLVMRTHGWRRLKWEDITKGKLPTFKYQMDSDYLQIKGKIINTGEHAAKRNTSVTMILQGKDSSKQYFLAPLQPDGSFRQRGIIFFDSAHIYYQLNGGDKKVNELSSVNFQYSLPLIPFANKIRVTSHNLADYDRQKHDNLFYAAVEKVKKNWDSVVVLKEVTVQSKIKSPIELLDEKYTTGLFSSKNGYSFDVMTDYSAKGSLDIFHYLQNMVPGMSLSLPILGANGSSDANSNNVPGINWRDGTPDIFLNEMPSDAQTVMGIQMSEVAYIKVFRPPFMGTTGSGASGAIVIYTRKAGDINTKAVKGMNNALLTGYSSYKEYYSPDYSFAQPKSPDTRTTLYWNPYVLTDKKNKTFKIDFFNNDVTHQFRLIVEGVNASGKLARVEKIIE